MSAWTPAHAAFEYLGQIREQLTKLQDLAADIDDDFFSSQLDFAMRANTTAMTRANTLLQLHRTTTGPADEDLDSQHVGGARGGR